MIKRFKKKQGLSPIVTTVLLIALTVVITSVVFLWFRGMVEEGVTKFGENIRLVCDDVNFQANYDSGSGTFSIANNGEVPIFRINLRISQAGSYVTKDIKDLSSSWPDTGLPTGGAFSANIASVVGSSDNILVLPVLIGTSTKGKKTFVCEGQYGEEISV